MAELFERLRYLIDFLEKGNQSEFARKIACAQTTLNGYLTTEGQRKVKVEFLKQILKTYPEISGLWLFQGINPILRSEVGEASKEVLDELEAMKAENERLKKELAEADRLNRKLTTKVLVEGDSNEKSVATAAKAAGQE